MRQIVTILILLYSIGFSEINAQKTDTLNVYYQALKLHLDYWDSFHKERPDLVKIPSVYYIEQDEYSTDSLPSLISGHKIEILKQADIYTLTKNKKGIALIAIRPARWENGRLMIYVIDFGVTRDRDNYEYSNGGGSAFQVVCMPNENGLGLKIIHQGGI